MEALSRIRWALLKGMDNLPQVTKRNMRTL